MVVLAAVALSVPVGASLASGSSGSSSLVGRLIGVPAASRTVLVSVDAVSLRDAAVDAVAVPVRGRYSMSVPRGPYLVIVRVSDLRTGRTIIRTSRPILAKASRSTVNLNVRAARASVRARAAKAGGPVVGIGEIPITSNVPGLYNPGASVEDGIIQGLLPSCQDDGGKLVDVSKEVRDALKTEQKLSDEGRTAFKFQLNPLAPALEIQGGVNVDATNGTAIADIKVVDPKTGNVVDHIVVRGDPGLIDGEVGNIGDVGPFLRQLGKGIGSRVCKPKPRRKPTPKPKPKRRPKPSCRGTAPQELCFTFDGSGSAQDSGGYPYGSKDANGTETWHMVWREPLQKLRISGGPYAPQAGSTATGHVVIHWDHSIPNSPPDCSTDISFDRAQTADTLYNSFSYTGQDRHSILMVATAPMFEQGATGSCPGRGADAEGDVLHPPAGFNIGAYEQLQFTFSDLPGSYSHTYGVGEHEFDGGGYHGSWTGKMTVDVGK